MAEEADQHVGQRNEQQTIKDSIQKLKQNLVPTVKGSLVISAVCNISMLIVGSLNVHKCPANKYIPLFLIVLGVLGLVSNFVSYFRNALSKRIHVVYIEFALYIGATIFFLLGTYWVYKEFQPSYDPEDGNLYCNKTAYLFAFIYITIFYAIFIATILGFLCFLCCMVLLLKRTSTYDVEGQPEASEAVEALTKGTETGPQPQ